MKMSEFVRNRLDLKKTVEEEGRVKYACSILGLTHMQLLDFYERRAKRSPTVASSIDLNQFIERVEAS